MSTGTITRQQLREAIQAGITQAKMLHADFTPDNAAKLRQVADTAELVARGGYHRWTMDESIRVGCPVVQAFPDYALLTWDTAFTRGHDAATRAMPHVLRVTDEPQEGTGA